MKNLTLILSCVLLCSCSLFTQHDYVSPTQKPLVLLPVKWSIVKVDEKVLYTLDQNNFNNLVLNMEDTQNRLWEDYFLINQK